MIHAWLRFLITVVVLSDVFFRDVDGFSNAMVGTWKARRTSSFAAVATSHVEKRHQTHTDEDEQLSSVYQSLDLRQVLERIAIYCGTFRGKHALLSLAENKNNQRNLLFRHEKNRMSRRQQQLRFDWDTTTVHHHRTPRPVFTCTLAKSAEEARLEYDKVNLAMTLINQNHIPPLYPDGIFDTINSNTDTDDDEWIELSPDEYSLENILQAEQVVKRIIQVMQWAQSDNTPSSLANIILNDTATMTLDRWETVLRELQNAVEIQKVRTAMDPTARSSYQFRISETKFPILKALRERESNMKQQQQQLMHTHSKSQTTRDDRLRELQEEIETKEKEILMGLARIVCTNARHIDVHLDHIARLDVIFAKAAYGLANGANGQVAIDKLQCVDVPHFVHPLLFESAVPVDLILREDQKALIISGSNGGGKTTVLKSFGLVCVLAKLGIPLVAKSSSSCIRIDFFDRVLVNVGDHQDILNQQSTYTAQLNRYAYILDQVSTNKSLSFLVLLDELGSGTEEHAGGAVGQAILEQLLEHNNCKVVATTHSPLLKTLSFVSDRIDCASVLLSSRNRRCHDSDASTSYQLPSFQLQYGCIGESNALGAASQILPHHVLERASEILNDGFNSYESAYPGISRSIDYMRALTESLEFKLRNAEKELVTAQKRAMDSRNIRKAMISLASAYDDHLSRLEQRVEHCFQTLKKDDSQQLLGDTLAELRVVRAKIKSEAELLRERGLRRIPLDYELKDGTIVVVACSDEECSTWDGMTGKVTSSPSHQNYPGYVSENSVGVSLSTGFGGDNSQLPSREVFFQRHQLAIWDYDSVWEDGVSRENEVKVARSIPEAIQRLDNLLLSVSSSKKEKKQTKPYSKFSSSRERKAVKRQKK